MSKIFFKTVLGLLAASAMAWPAQAALTGTKVLSGHVPQASTLLAPTSNLSGEANLQLAISLPWRNPAGLTNLLQQMYDPSSTNYHRYLSTSEFTAQFGPTEQDYQKIKDFATASGFTISGTHPNRVLLDVTAKVSDTERAFHVKFHNYQHPKEARLFFAPDSEPSVDAALPILHISGMDNYYIPRPKMTARSIGRVSDISPNSGSGVIGSFQGKDFRNAYVPGTTLTGAGQSVGLLQFDAYFTSDVTTYASIIGLTNLPNLVIVPIDGGVPFPGGGNGEVALDIEMTLSMAPGVSNIYVYEAPNPSPWVDLLSRMANDNLAKQLSCSWGGGPPDAAGEQIFQQMAVQGQTFFDASGDTDASVGAIPFPGESPNITQVGGTGLFTDAQGRYVTETVWNDHQPRAGQEEGSSGGVSPTYTIPTWQQGFGTAANHGSPTQRNIPDVSMTASNVFIVADNGVEEISGGTSAASPLWSGFIALVNQQAAINAHASVGFINPTIYALAKTTGYTNFFNDTTNGDNTWPGSPTNYFAVTGYDLCTGLGSPKGTNLINALIGVGVVLPPTLVVSAPPQPWGTTLGALNGSNPNGDWFLFVLDDKQFDIGAISNGWSATLVTANPVGPSADNQIYVTPTNQPLFISPNSYWNLTLSVTNYGPSVSSNVYVTDTLPIAPGITLASNIVTLGYVSLTGNSLTWNLGTLTNNAGGTMKLSLFMSPPGTYTNTATISAFTDDANSDDDTAVSTVVVGTPNAPQLSAVASGSGGIFQFSITSGPGQTNIVQASTNLVDPNGWVPVFTNVGPFIFMDPKSTNYPTRFYRDVIIGP